METVDGVAVGVPVRLGKYTLLTRLATGGMGEVYVAQMSGAAGFAKQVVIKRILPQLAQDEHFVQMFLDEARITAQLNHPNICQVFELGEIANEYFIAMEYLEGLALSKLFEKCAPGCLDLRIAAGMMAQACEGLAHAHEFSDPVRQIEGIVHRDVSPQNLFATTAGLVKVLDFGVAKLHRAGSQTVTGSAKGKHLYMSPEQVRGEAVDHRADIFALGAVLFEAITGERLFRRGTEFQTLQAIITGERARIEDFRSDVPGSVSEVVERALHLDREQRYASARDMADALTQAVAPLGGAASITELARFVRCDHTSEISSQRDRIRRVSAQMQAAAVPPELLDEDDGGHGDSLASPSWGRSPVTTPHTGTAITTHTPRRNSSVMGTAVHGRRASSITDATKSEPGSGERLSGVSALAPFASGAGIDSGMDASLSGPQRGYARWGILIGAALAVALWFGHRTLSDSGAGPTITSRPMATAAGASVTPGAAGAAAQPASSHPSAARGAPSHAPAQSQDHAPGQAPDPMPDPTVDPMPDPMPDPTADQAAGQVEGQAVHRDDAPADHDAPAGNEVLGARGADGEKSSDTQHEDRQTSPGVHDAKKGPSRVRGHRGRRGRPAQAPIRRAAPQREPGYLTIDATPYAEIYVDGSKIGITPLVRVPLTVGPHTIRAVSKGGDSKRLQVRIKPGETVSHRVRFSQAKR